MFFKLFDLRGLMKCPHKPRLSCNTNVIHVIIQICVLKNHINQHTHTHTHTLNWNLQNLNIEQKP